MIYQDNLTVCTFIVASMLVEELGLTWAILFLIIDVVLQQACPHTTTT